MTIKFFDNKYFFLLLILYSIFTYTRMGKSYILLNTKNDIKKEKEEKEKCDVVINIQNGPCKFLKKNLYVCLKNSDGNITVCQNVRNAYEFCLENHFNQIKNE